ncbi:MAG TPA: NAD(P)-binding protein, partial [Enhygromyxa sp.]|nr:NAD(P)-binding protein [Enhygromyxa sp.]
MTKQKIAILGGGVGAMTAAWALSETPALRERFEITVHQLGWRLGGKGASGRNAEHGQRIEEHGLHVWLGWYRNAFSLLRRCYEELDRPPEAPLARIEQAFVAHDYVGVAHGASSHARSFWMLEFPRNDRAIGDDEPAQLRAGLEITLRLIARHLRASLLRPVEPGEHPDDRTRAWLRPGVLLGLAGKARRLALARTLALLDELAASRNPAGVATELLDRLRPRLATIAAHVGDAEQELDGLLMLLDFCTATLRGLVRDRALLFGLDALDGWELREWLRRHGARPSTVDAPFIKAWYDLAFAYEQGDTTRPNFAAGAALRAILRTSLSYDGAIFWKMKAGMGDVVFAPIYEVLRRRGVRFEFFHRVDALEVEPVEHPSTTAKHRVARVRMTVQATPKSGEYNPLVDVGGLPCWPSAPLLDQLAEGPALAGIDLECPWSSWPGVGQRVLERGRDFDIVIFGISLGAVAQLCPGLIERDPAWKRMVDQVATVATQAVQLWMEPSLDELGWRQPSPILDAYEDPFNTWADMSFLLERERWEHQPPPRSLAYLLGPLHEHEPPPEFGPAADGFQARQVDAVRARARRWLDRAGPGLWPATARGGGYPSFDASVVCSEYARANVAGSERYVQSLRGTTRHRLFTERCGVEGLYPVGDWLNTGINSGDVEAATISGLQAARAILGHAQPIVGEGDGWARHQVDRH